MNETALSSSSSDAWARRVTALMLAGALVLAIALAGLSRASMSTGTQGATATVAAIPNQGPFEIVVEIVGMEGDGGVEAGLLSKSGNRYERTTDRLQIVLPADVQIVMGGPADIRVGAVLHIRGERTGAAEDLVASRVVVLTSNVELD